MERISMTLIKTSLPCFEEDDINQLVESIREQGLLHPITVCKVDSHYEVIAGFKRLAAMKILEFPVVSCEVKDGDLSQDQKTEIRLHENLKRGNLPWYEQVKLVQQLHELRQTQHGVAPAQGGRPARDGRNTGWSTRDTAEELKRQFGGSGSAGGVAQDLQLAAAVQMDPNLAKVKDKKTALKLIRIKSKRQEAEGFTGVENFGIEDEILLGDSADLLKSVPDNTFHACLTDPPWLNFAPAQGTGLTRDESTLPVFEQVYRVLRNDSLLYAVVSLDDFNFYHTELQRFGFTVQGTPLIWAKTGGLSRRGMAAWQYARDYEFIVLAAKGNPVLTTATQQSSIFTYDVVPPVKMVHPHEKPPSLYRRLLEDCTFEGAYVLDPFAGSFVVPEVCRSLKRHYLASEREPEYFEKGQRRLAVKP